MIQKIALIACSGSKLDHPARARELYTGALFRLSVRFAERTLGLPWAVLSAKHGLVLPNAMLAPYDQRLPGARSALDAWAREAAAEFTAAFGVLSQGSQIIFLAGAPYKTVAAHIQGSFLEIDPLRRMQIGERLAWLKRAVEGPRPGSARGARS